MIKDKIFIQQWLDYHPYENPVKSDFYYLKICNEIDAVLKKVDTRLNRKDPEKHRKELSVMLTCWFEDLISELGIWNAFILNHHGMYGKYLPFYLDEEAGYFAGEINPQDIKFLIWYYLNIQHFDEAIISPESELLEITSESIFCVLDKAWDDAPVNTQLKSFFDIPVDADFYAVRYLIDWLVLNSYLFKYLGRENEEKKLETAKTLFFDKDFPNENIDHILFRMHDDAVHHTITHLMAMKGKTWLAWTLGATHPLYNPLLEMSDKKEGHYLFEGEDEKSLRFKHIASGKTLDVTKQSIENHNFVPGKTVLDTAFVSWKNEWWYSGIYLQKEMDDEILLQETSNPYYAALFTDNNIHHEFLEEQYKSFLEFNNNKPVRFASTTRDLNQFLEEYVSFHNNRMDLKHETKPSDSKIGSPPQIKEKTSTSNIVVFFNKEVGIEVVPFAQFVPDKSNPFYNPNADPGDLVQMIFSDLVSKDFILCLMRNYKIPFPLFNNDNDDPILKNNLDFLLRFFKREDYHRKSQVVLI